MTIDGIQTSAPLAVKNATVALLTNFLPPYRIPLFEALERELGALRIFLSTRMEPNRPWPVQWRQLKVTLQRTFSFRQTWRHPNGFSEPLYVQIPYDTLWALAAIRPQVVVSGELGLRTILAAAYRWLAPHSRLIVWATLSEYSEQGRGRLREWLRRWILRSVDAVLVNGESGARYIRHFGVPDERIFRVPYTTNSEPFSAVPMDRAERSHPRLLYVGQLVERKGLQHLFEVLGHWGAAHPDAELELWLVGDGPQRPELEASRLPSNITCQFLGNIAYDELPGVYAQADLFVLPTLADEWGLVVNEAMASGLPVLGSRYAQAVEELVVEGENGWIFRPDDADDMRAAMERALATPGDRLEAMRSAARSRVESLTPELVAAKMVAAIRYVLER
ncbi:MAG TPA: glycosyltransferase family 4 protein [Stenomitos sp.]